MNTLGKTIVVILFILFSMPVNVFAYVDPSSINAIWQFLGAIIIGGITAFAFLKTRIITFLKKIFKNLNIK